MHINKQVFAKRLRSSRGAAGLTQQALAEKIGVNRVTLVNWEAGVYSPDATKLPAIAIALDVDAEWLSGQVESGGVPVSTDGDRAPLRERAWIDVPRYVSSERSAQSGPQVGDSWIRVRRSVAEAWNINNLVQVNIHGDEMSPTVCIGDEALVDMGSLPRNGLVLVNIDGDMLVRRSSSLGGGRFRISCDQPIYPPIDVDVNDESIVIMGRVALVIRKI